MLRVMLVLGLLVLVPAAIVFWRTRDRTVVEAPSGAEKSTVYTRPLGTSTLSHGGPAPAGGSAPPDRSPSGIVEAPARRGDR